MPAIRVICSWCTVMGAVIVVGEAGVNEYIKLYVLLKYIEDVPYPKADETIAGLVKDMLDLGYKCTMKNKLRVDCKGSITPDGREEGLVTITWLSQGEQNIQEILSYHMEKWRKELMRTFQK